MLDVSNTPPGNPFSPRQVRILKISVAVMSVLLVLGLIALVFGMARQASRAARRPALPVSGEAPYVQSPALGRGEVKAIFVDNGVIVIHWKGDAGEAVISYEALSGRELGRIQIPQQ